MDNRKETIIAAMVGNALEYYDVTLFALLSSYLAPLFFPSDNLVVSQLYAYGALASGFFMRPFGGLVFGHLGDRYGRRKALIIAVLLTTVPTVTIGMLPTYKDIGMAAPIIIVLCRLMQGFCTAAEYSGAAVLITETVDSKKIGSRSSWLPASSLVGALLGMFIGSFCIRESMPIEAWRYPFLLGGVFGLAAFFLRTRISESPLFERIERNNNTLSIPISDVFKKHFRGCLCNMAIGSAILGPFYLSTVYIPEVVLVQKLGVSQSMSMQINTWSMLYWIILFPIAGYWSDKIGLKNMMISACILIIVLILPIFWALINYASFATVITAQVVLGVCSALLVAPNGAFVAQLFPVKDRYSGVAVSGGIGEALFGGSTTWIATKLVLLTGNQFAPAFYLIFCTTIGLMGIVAARPYKVNDIS